MNPKHPMYIVSKGRAVEGVTTKYFNKMRIPHYIAVEPQDMEDYEKTKGPYTTLLELPFSNHGDGPGRARNWVWDHSKEELGAESHWVFDDNIAGFLRLHKNVRLRISDGSLFRFCEEFIDRYENVPVSGLQYRAFIAPTSFYPPYVKNTRIYSALLIRNDCEFRWRGRYNEDTDLSLRVLKAGQCTIQFNILLQEKMVTQALKGGNTAEFYHAEGDDSHNIVDNKRYTGTIKKSQMLVDLHPDVCRIEEKWGRIHHYCDYGPFKANKLILKPEFEGILDEPYTPNEYGMKLCKTTKDGDYVQAYDSIEDGFNTLDW
jgi:hypothetical protein